LNGFKDFILIFVGNGFSGFSVLRIDISEEFNKTHILLKTE